MGSYIDKTWLEARITKAKEMIATYEDAIAAVAVVGQSYTLDTGQTKQTVTKANLTELRNALAYWENKLSTYEAKIEGRALQAKPGF